MCKEEKPRYTHVQVGEGRLTLAIHPTRLEYGVAWCSPEDNFCRKLGRTISTGRMNKRPKHLSAEDLLAVKDANWKDTRSKFIHTVLESDDVPNWVKAMNEGEQLGNEKID